MNRRAFLSGLSDARSFPGQRLFLGCDLPPARRLAERLDAIRYLLELDERDYTNRIAKPALLI